MKKILASAMALLVSSAYAGDLKAPFCFSYFESSSQRSKKSKYKRATCNGEVVKNIMVMEMWLLLVTL